MQDLSHLVSRRCVLLADEKPPRARFVQTPGDGGPETVFDFVCDEPVCLFEYRVLNSGSMVIRDWSLVRPPIDFREWLDSGVYTFELRSYDPAGNRDVEIVPGINSHTWEYVPPLPWLLIILCILAFLILCVVIFILYRRYVPPPPCSLARRRRPYVGTHVLPAVEKQF